MKYKKGTGLWDEDHVNDYNASTYLSARSTMRWYYAMERHQTRNNLNARRATQSYNNNKGLHFSGRGAFEREMDRQGIPVEKYSLTTTTGAKRVAEMVLLRRAELEKKSKAMMAEHGNSLRQAAPSSWFNETEGPLNPVFVKVMQPHYTEAIFPLPEHPVNVAS